MGIRTLQFVNLEHPISHGLIDCAVIGAPSEMDAMRSAFDGQLVEVTLVGYGLPEQKFNVQLRAVAPSDSHIMFNAAIYKVTQRTLRSAYSTERFGEFSGYYRKGDRQGGAFLTRDLVNKMGEYMDNIPVSQAAHRIQVMR